MKKTILAAAMICFSSFQSFSQSLTDKTMSFFGVDFTKARMIGEGFENKEDLKNKIVAWNELFKVEPDKYDLYKPFRKQTIDFDFAEVTKRNAAINTAGIVGQGDYTISTDQAASVAKNYGQGKTGLGCVFVVQSFDKNQAMGTIYVVFFDMGTKKTVLVKKMEEKAAGFGLKNYWARVILNTIEDSGSQFGKWLKGK
jgi:hypothetical protein